jgi:hypothetical protein
MEPPLLYADRVTWSNQDGRTVGAIGPVRIVLAGSARIPPGLPQLEGFDRADAGSIAFLYATPGDEARGRCAIQIHLQGQPPAHGHSMDIRGRMAVVEILDPAASSHVHAAYASLEAALEAALHTMTLLGADL